MGDVVPWPGPTSFARREQELTARLRNFQGMLAVPPPWKSQASGMTVVAMAQMRKDVGSLAKELQTLSRVGNRQEQQLAGFRALSAELRARTAELERQLGSAQRAADRLLLRRSQLEEDLRAEQLATRRLECRLQSLGSLEELAARCVSLEQAAGAAEERERVASAALEEAERRCEGSEARGRRLERALDLAATELARRGEEGSEAGRSEEGGRSPRSYGPQRRRAALLGVAEAQDRAAAAQRRADARGGECEALRTALEVAQSHLEKQQRKIEAAREEVGAERAQARAAEEARARGEEACLALQARLRELERTLLARDRDALAARVVAKRRESLGSRARENVGGILNGATLEDAAGVRGASAAARGKPLREAPAKSEAEARPRDDRAACARSRASAAASGGDGRVLVSLSRPATKAGRGVAARAASSGGPPREGAASDEDTIARIEREIAAWGSEKRGPATSRRDLIAPEGKRGAPLAAGDEAWKEAPGATSAWKEAPGAASAWKETPGATSAWKEAPGAASASPAARRAAPRLAVEEGGLVRWQTNPLARVDAPSPVPPLQLGAPAPPPQPRAETSGESAAPAAGPLWGCGVGVAPYPLLDVVLGSREGGESRSAGARSEPRGFLTAASTASGEETPRLLSPLGPRADSRRSAKGFRLDSLAEPARAASPGSPHWSALGATGWLTQDGSADVPGSLGGVGGGGSSLRRARPDEEASLPSLSCSAAAPDYFGLGAAPSLDQLAALELSGEEWR